jgi:uncharacterized cupredoxin-like copper-binding protein
MSKRRATGKRTLEDLSCRAHQRERSGSSKLGLAGAGGKGSVSAEPGRAGAMGVCKLALMSIAGLSILLTWSLSADAQFRYGHLVQIHELTFVPDSAQVQGDAFTVLVIQNREEGPILHEVRSKDLFEPGTLISVQGTGTVEYEGKQVSRVLLAPGEEVVIWYYAAKGRTYTYQCTINGHSMQGTVQAV